MRGLHQIAASNTALVDALEASFLRRRTKTLEALRDADEENDETAEKPADEQMSLYLDEDND